MTGKKKSKADLPASKPPLLVFGLDENGKPKAARFLGEQIEQARQASASMKLDLYEALTADQQELARKLPSGRIYAKGRAFVPFIKRDLFDKLKLATSGAAANAHTAGAAEVPSPSDQQSPR